MSINKGRFTKHDKYRVIRDGKLIQEDLEIANLKHFKNEVSEVKKGEECGIIFFKFGDFQLGDVVEAYEVKDLQKKFKAN